MQALERTEKTHRVNDSFGDNEEALEEAVGLFNSMSVLPYEFSKAKAIKSSSVTPESNGENELIGLLAGLKPLRDKYLAHALNRMNAPVLQVMRSR